MGNIIPQTNAQAYLKEFLRLLYVLVLFLTIGRKYGITRPALTYFYSIEALTVANGNSALQGKKLVREEAC